MAAPRQLRNWAGTFDVDPPCSEVVTGAAPPHPCISTGQVTHTEQQQQGMRLDSLPPPRQSPDRSPPLPVAARLLQLQTAAGASASSVTDRWFPARRRRSSRVSPAASASPPSGSGSGSPSPGASRSLAGASIRAARAEPTGRVGNQADGRGLAGGSLRG